MNVTVRNFGEFTPFRFFTMNLAYGLGLAFFGNIVDNIVGVKFLLIFLELITGALLAILGLV